MLVIYAHPHRNGHCGLVLKTVVQELKRNNTSFEIIDLYESNFNPVLQAQELYTDGKKTSEKTIIDLQEKIKNTDKMIFIYPTWWNNPPAILKGFFDRVLTGGFAFKYINNMPIGLLNGKKAIVFTTTGAPTLIARLFLKARSLQAVTHDTLKFCGITAKGVILGNSRKFDDIKKEFIKKKVSKRISSFI